MVEYETLKKDFDVAIASLIKKHGPSSDEVIFDYHDTLVLLKCLTDYSSMITDQLNDHFRNAKRT